MTIEGFSVGASASVVCLFGGEGGGDFIVVVVWVFDRLFVCLFVLVTQTSFEGSY